MSNFTQQHLQQPTASNVVSNVLGQPSTAPFYIWANEDCSDKSESFKDAKTIRLALVNAGGASVHIVDADGVEVVDAEIQAHEELVKAGYFAGARSPGIKPEFAGAFMVNDPEDPDGYAIVGDDIAELILEARDHLIDDSSASDDQIPSTRQASADLPPALLGALTLDVLNTLVACAAAHVEDVDTGLAEGLYSKDDNEDLGAKRAALEAAQLFLQQNLQSAPGQVPTTDEGGSTEQAITTLVFLRHEKSQVPNIAVLSLRTLLENDRDVMEALIGATTEWVSTTTAGRDLWDFSCNDLNIGDLASSTAFTDEAFLAALRARGVEYVSSEFVSGGAACSYDEVLVDMRYVVQADAAM